MIWYFMVFWNIHDFISLSSSASIHTWTFVLFFIFHQMCFIGKKMSNIWIICVVIINVAQFCIYQQILNEKFIFWFLLNLFVVFACFTMYIFNYGIYSRNLLWSLVSWKNMLKFIIDQPPTLDLKSTKCRLLCRK